jgi:CHAT domain-containing protein/Tfp pilus assembly protein PilF
MAKRARGLAATGELRDAIELGQQALALAKSQYGPRDQYVAYILDDLATWHYRQQRTEEALALATEAVDIIRTARPESSPEVATLVNNLGTIHAALGQLPRALVLYEESYAALVKSVGPKHPLAVQTARNAGTACMELSRFDDARKYFGAALEANRALHGEQAVATARAYLDLADASLRQEHPKEAAELAARALRIVDAQPSASPADSAAVRIKLAQIDIRESRLAAAKAKLNDALQRAGPQADPLLRASILYQLGWIHILRREALEADRVYREVLALYRAAVGPRHPAVARTLHSLAIVQQDLGQQDAATSYYEQAIGIFSGSLGESDPSVAATRLEFASLLAEWNRPAEAIEQARQALRILDRLPGRWEVKRGYATAVLALAQHKAGDLEEASRSYLVALKLISDVRGERSSDLPPGLTDLGRIYRAQGRLDDAERFLRRAVAIREQDGAATAAGLAESLSELSRVRMAKGEPIEALDLARRAVSIADGRRELAQRSLSAAALAEQRQARGLFEHFLRVGWANGPSNRDELAREMFTVAQLPHLTGTSAAISRMAVRLSTGDASLEQLVREREDAVDEWRALDRALVDQLIRASDRLGELPADSLRRSGELVRRIETMDERLSREFPRYAELTAPSAVAATAVQPLLNADEALLLHVTAADGTFLFLLTRRGLKLARTELGSAELQAAVESLRRGLDLQSIRRLDQLPPFDTFSAHLLYRPIMQPFEQELTEVKHIVAVLDRAMQNLPLALLLRKPSAPPARFSEFSALDFLGRRFAFSVVPSASAFVVLRASAESPRARKPFVGFADPDFRGSGTRASAALASRSTTRPDPEALRSRLAPLPETRGEVTRLARLLQAPQADLHFGTQASEAMVKRTDLSRYRIVAFATHGLLAGEFRGLAEPALVLSPPAQGTEVDDGLLTASEIAALRLNAEWVLLSACNTAAPAGDSGAEGLSGLARAFFYAGSRALLVSHWWVASDATALLTTGAIDALVKEPAIGRAEALRRATLPLMEGRVRAQFAHPAFWAPFVNVGEGGSLR